jgi:hypothetical protein
MTRQDSYKLNNHVTGKMQSVRWNEAVVLAILFITATTIVMLATKGA